VQYSPIITTSQTVYLITQMLVAATELTMQ